uniref:NADH dehydrogenase subunit 6 n=1 Tax=Syphacia muris TaxID=451379 RepID=A0A347YCD1_9BILA|nr:NADH dehydrogenase subunit 6 [Syphacia muris]
MVMSLCMVMSMFMCVMFYLSLDPMKCSFFLVLSLCLIMPGLSLGLHFWYSYYVCLIFLSGVFVILVYFSSLSKFSYMKKPFIVLLVILSILGGEVYYEVISMSLSLNEFYYDYYCIVLFYIIFLLVYFLNFVSCYLVGGTAMRSM